MSAQAALKVAIVGHTNTGKTSLLRTLTRDVGFGEISARPGTTRHVEGTTLMVGGAPGIELYDTPGLEDSASLLSLLESDPDGDGVERVSRFLDSTAARGDLEQEAKVLRQVLGSEILLYVIDAREPILGRHRDELSVLSMAARPLIPVLNFTGSIESREAQWREQLARLSLHAVVAFDTVLFNRDDERRLFEAMQALLAPRYGLLQQLIDERESAWQGLRRAAAGAVADMLIDSAGAARSVAQDDNAALQAAGEWLQQQLRDREARCIQQLLDIFAFRPEDVVAATLPIQDGRWQMDLFASETLARFGLSAGSGAVKGAAVGLGIDVLTGGLSLGMAATLGAAIGAIWSTLDRYGRRLVDRLRGHVEVRADDNTLRLLAARELELIGALLRRGHASMSQVQVSATPAVPWRDASLPSALQRARLHPEWSTLSAASGRASGDSERSTTLHALQTELLAML